MRYVDTLGSRHPSARRGAELEANLSAMQRDAQEQARPLFERDDGAGAHFLGIDRGWGFCLEVPQLWLGGGGR
ncbi:MAG: hypothetical protein BroJett013_07060 [Alphaproteobacteria bacterium]|nr:MAG: hypothetical protein BroJett013_07060 [Alphaproteobacteria bacterium]